MAVSPGSHPASRQTQGTDNVRGALWMLGGVMCFAATAVLIKLAGQTLHTFEIVFFRCVFGLLVVVPLILQSGRKAFRVRQPAVHALRVCCAICGMMGGFYAMTQLELATAISLSFSRPLFMIVLAVVFLGEVVRWRRGLATLTGFIGVVIMIQPGVVTFEPAMAAALISALAVAAALATVKVLAKDNEPVTIMLTFSLGTVVVAAIPAAFVWQMPAPGEWLNLVGLGITASLGQYAFIRAFTLGEATVMSPIDYLQIIIGTAAGLILFQEVPSVWTLAGAVIVVAATLYILRRGAQVEAPPPPPPDPGAASIKP